MLTRRTFLGASALLAVANETVSEAVARPASGDAGGLTWAELPLARGRGDAYRALVLRPARAAPDRTYPGLLLFHGRGESRSPELGLHAWRTAYGLERAHARLARPPLSLAASERRYIQPERLAALDAALRDEPFSGLIYVCPVTPNPHRARSPAALLDGYAEWIEHTLLPAARAAAPLAPGRLGVDGCSMGGYVAAEVFARRPHLFRTFGVVQPAIGRHRVAGYSRRLRDARTAGTLRAVHLQSSTRDPYLAAARAWAGELARLGVESTLDVLPGPHDQRWLRATGTLVMLAWHELQLRQHA